MATITKRKSGKWTAQIRSHKKYISKTFLKKSDASAWVKEKEVSGPLRLALIIKN